MAYEGQSVKFSDSFSRGKALELSVPQPAPTGYQPVTAFEKND
jgi:hypothetical protein